MKTILLAILLTFTCPKWVRADFTAADWHHVGVNAPPFTDVPWGERGFNSLVIDNEGKPIVAGAFSSLAGHTVGAVAKWNGTSWQGFGSGLAFSGFSPSLYHASNLVLDGTNIYVGGRFRFPDEGPIGRYLAWWNGVEWNYDSYQYEASGFRLIDSDLLAVENGVIYVTGRFQLSDDYDDIAQCIASWSPTLGWRKLGQLPLDENVTEMLADGQDLYISGNFSSIIGSPTYTGAVAAKKIAKWNGLNWSALGSGFEERPESLVIHQGALIVSGPFEQAGESGFKNLARWDGQIWTEYAGGMPLSLSMTSPGPPPVYIRNFARSMTSDGQRLWVGGVFSYLDGHPGNSVNYWNGSTWNMLPGGPRGEFGGAGNLVIFQKQLYCLEGETDSKNIYRADLSALSKSYKGAASYEGLVGSNSQPLATPFSDGVPNLIKYAFNLNLAAADRRTMVPEGAAGLPHISQVPGESPVFRFEYLRRLNAGLNYLPQTSTSLGAGDWQPVTVTPQITPVDASWERVVYEVPATAERMFGRVGVELEE